MGGTPCEAGPDLGASAMPWSERANFNGYHYYLGERYTIGRLELALLQDLGWTLEGGITLTDVVNTWEDRSNTHYKVGWGSDESLSGDVLADHIEGRGGRDLLAGLDGDDRLDGGEGDDTLLGGDGRDSLSGGAGNDRIEGGAGLDQAHFALVRSAYAVSAGAAGVVVQALSGGEGRDEIGRTVTFPSDYRGRKLVVSYIYTHCPDVCIVTTTGLEKARKQLAKSDDVTFVSITLDPRRDDTTALRQYAELREIDTKIGTSSPAPNPRLIHCWMR